MNDRPEIVWLVYREGLNSVFLSQMAAPARLLAREGWPVGIWAFASVGEFVRPLHRRMWNAVRDAAGVRIVRWPSPPARHRRLWDETRALSAALRCLARGKTVVDCCGTFAAAMAAEARPRLPHVALMFHMYGLTHEEAVLAAPGEWPVERRAEHDRLRDLMVAACRGADAVVCVSHAMARYAVQRLGADAARVSVVPCCVDMEPFRRADGTRQDLRRRLGLSDRFVVVYCGSHALWEAAAETLAVFRTIRSLEPTAHALILTTNPEAFRRDLCAAGIPDTDATVLSVLHPDVPAHLCAADLALLIRTPSVVNATASPVKFAEYLAAGLPVVISEGVGDFSAEVERHHLGVVLRHGEDPAPRLQAFLRNARQDPDVFRPGCAAWAQANLSWSVHLPRLERLYEAMTERTPHPATACRRLANALRLAKEHGLRSAAEHFLYRLTEATYERRLGIETSRVRELSEFDIQDRRLRECRPAPHGLISMILRRLRIRPGVDVLADIGAGSGRMVVRAATRPFRRVVGVELVPEIAELARENIRRARRRVRCPDVDVVAGDATVFPLPPDTTVFVLNNPFGGEPLARVFENIRASLLAHPRPHTIVYLRPPGSGEGWVGEQPWLRRTAILCGLKAEMAYFYELAPEAAAERHPAAGTSS